MGGGCVDRDECADNATLCAATANTECENKVGGFECVCESGFYKNASGDCVGETAVGGP